MEHGCARHHGRHPGQEGEHVAEVEAALQTASQLPGWFGDGPAGARGIYQVTADDLRDEAAVLGAARQLAVETSAAVKHLQSRLATLRGEAAAARMRIHPDGVVTADVTENPDDDAAREEQRQGLEIAAKALIAQAADVDGDAERVFNAIRNGHISTNGAANTEDAMRAGAGQGGLTPFEPPEGKSPAEIKAYWDALPPDQQHNLLQHRPDLLGNLDGIPSSVRHDANMRRLGGVLSALEARRKQLEKQIDDHVFGGLLTNEDAELEQVKRKIADAGKLKELMNQDAWSEINPNGRMLLVLDMTTGEQGKAAISIGNPDDADHIAVTTPGMNTNIRGSMTDMLSESNALRAETVSQLERAGAPGQKVATITWLDYEPPDKGNTRPFADQYSWAEAMQQDRAVVGARDLARFYNCLEATSTRDDPHIVALGHSYGSLTQGLALQESGGHPVDDAVFYGSPGFEASDEPELGLRQGHGYVMQGDDDDIRHVTSKGGVGPNGPAPTSTQLEQLDVNARTTADGVAREGAHTHADYPRMGDRVGPDGEKTLRVSGYLMARILAGLPPE